MFGGGARRANISEIKDVKKIEHPISDEFTETNTINNEKTGVTNEALIYFNTLGNTKTEK